MTEKLSTHLLIIGAGPGGYTAAFDARSRGMDVTLVDISPTFGGVCLSRGCIPSKTILHATELITQVKNAELMGVAAEKLFVSIEKLREHKKAVITSLENGLAHLVKQQKIRVITGSASFTSSTTAIIKDTNTSQETQITFTHAIIATGSRPRPLAGVPTSARIIDSTAALELTDVPKKLLVIGGGYIGLELGSAYAALGSNVTLIEMTPSLLPGTDSDLIRILQLRLKKIFASIRVNCRATRFEETPTGITVTLEDAEKKQSQETYDTVFVAVGRIPCTDTLALETTNVQRTDAGFITVDPSRRTNDKNIYAVGDVTGNPMLAHKATHEAHVAVAAIAGEKATFTPKAIPAVIFTDPAVAYCGLMEDEAARRGQAVATTTVRWSTSGRATTLGRPDGMTKLIIDPSTHKILGVGIVGVHADELISEGVVAIEAGLTVSQLKRCIHPHPTLSETLMDAAEKFPTA